MLFRSTTSRVVRAFALLAVFVVLGWAQLVGAQPGPANAGVTTNLMRCCGQSSGGYGSASAALILHRFGGHRSTRRSTPRTVRDLNSPSRSAIASGCRSPRRIRSASSCTAHAALRHTCSIAASTRATVVRSGGASASNNCPQMIRLAPLVVCEAVQVPKTWFVIGQMWLRIAQEQREPTTTGAR